MPEMGNELVSSQEVNNCALGLAGRTAIIAGNGQLPIAVAAALKKQGQPPFLIPLRGEAHSSLYEFEHCEISIVEFAKLARSLKISGAKNVVLAGGVQSRPHLKDLRFDRPTLVALPRLVFSIGKGDDALLRAFISLIEAYGFHVVGAHQVVPELLAPQNACLTIKRAEKKELQNIRIAAEAAHMLGALDVGQGAVAVGGRVVALEGAEGTDNMLKRVIEMRQEQRIPQKGGVLVKVKKPEQDERADLPTIGPLTFENAHRAGLEGVAVEARRSFILELEKTIETADQYGMFIETI